MELFNFKDIAPFREPALMFDKYGYYTDAAVDTAEYNRYWDEQEKRCLEGYTVDDIRITGDHYWYLNFSRIDKKDNNETGKKTTQKIEGFPDFWDGDYIYYHVLDIARNGITKEAYEKLKLPVKIKEEDLAGGKHLGVLKTRRRGYSYKNAALATKYYSLIRKSTIYLTAFEKELFSTIVAMTSQNLNFLSEHTGFGKTRDYINKLTADNFHIEASYKKTLPDGKEIKKGYLSQIKAISFKDDPNSLRGKSASLVLFEEAGSFPILKDAWNITRPSLEDGKFITGTMIAFGTGGDAGSMDFIDMFNNPEPYNMIALENVWSDNKAGTFVSFFAPDYLNRVGFIDKNGNSDWEGAKAYETSKREHIIKTSNDSSIIDKRKAEYPFTPEEAVLSINANKFPVGDLANQLAKIESNRKYFDAEFNGSFIINELNEPEFRIDTKAIPIRSFPPRGGEDISGCITIWEHPYKNSDDKVPYGMYVAGIDPVALEEAPTSTSINSTFIFNTMTNTIVAEYSGRLNNSKEYYEQVRRLIKYYNAVLLYENMVTGIFDYFDYKEELYLLADPPQILANLISDSRVKRKKGCHMTPAVKAHGVDLINNWLRDDGNEEGVSNVYNIRSAGLLKELINYNKEDNFDRVFGLIMTLLQANETRRVKEDPDIQVALTKNQKFFHKRIFTKTGGLRTGTLVKILNETV